MAWKHCFTDVHVPGVFACNLIHEAILPGFRVNEDLLLSGFCLRSWFAVLAGTHYTTHTFTPCLQAWKIYRSLDVEYVFVVFGGLIGYPSDDINKFLWMVGAVCTSSPAPTAYTAGNDLLHIHRLSHDILHSSA
jgi:hypothetical protein